ncbi:hypothetical protein [Pantoea piersonii]|uniref:hypothetical protein n=1 Tax=Pantoea piersonii TaxID=2364647 RepID=UPI000EA102C1|nr:hypothetical protein [Pantoea piersonii]MBZ6385914.1 hypothetical protein [Pantoea piersonii]MBZ6399489.1 hypothetical protein [Pantoea piersonii]MBZ6407988.1 hypothetical protein [Pantoea piersonii]MBZ6427256.1 hypothetical protein [Pantoea piersonii]NYB04494.1 hypothetical protein [Pantoea piersonii]
MLRVDFNTEFYAFQIRQLAARYQCGEGLKDIEKLVDSVIISMEEKLKRDYVNRFHLEIWSQLFENLNAYINKFSDPAWMMVIAYAKRQVMRKKGAAKAKFKYDQLKHY